MSISKEVVQALSSVLTFKDGLVPLHAPVFSGNELAYTKECIDSTFVSSVGKFVDQFEKMLAEYTGSKRAVAVTNGTAALHMALMLAGVKNDDEVIIPGLTFIATANAVAYIGAVPHIVDSEETTLGIDASKLDRHLSEIAEVRSGECFNKQTGRRIAALVPMHVFGIPLDLDGLLALCEKFSIPMVEDAAEAIGSFYKGKHCGRFGKISSLSFNGNKTITTGGGGAVLTDDDKLADLCKHMTTTAKIPHKWEYFHDMVGYNYRMPNINAALGCAQMEKLDDILASKRKLAEAYATAFSTVKGVHFLTEPEGCKSNYWFNTIILEKGMEEERDSVLEATNGASYMTRPLWAAMHRLTMYENCPRTDMSVAESLEKRVINIPSGAGILGV
ncbi:LegC family aminotransferase [Desulfovibrio gilichinskyi]|uniref:GDP-perosamine synthase n=1 Tax=Desulfovibrio gilichinskyi TaxID=1519643 RepID=A0A1X7EIE1_9BACT|nr:LegC family aminotransferase [Desulfovibrio gilichinskyi]SMF34033.1 perosamine synthetase [Desulfovibrio gilichinskyi]